MIMPMETTAAASEPGPITHTHGTVQRIDLKIAGIYLLVWTVCEIHAPLIALPENHGIAFFREFPESDFPRQFLSDLQNKIDGNMRGTPIIGSVDE